MARRRVRSDEERRIRADERLREELSRGCEYSGTQEIVQETFEEMREQLGMEGDWDEIGVTDTDNREFVFIKESLSKRDTAIHRYLETAATIAGIRYMIPF